MIGSCIYHVISSLLSEATLAQVLSSFIVDCPFLDRFSPAHFLRESMERLRDILPKRDDRFRALASHAVAQRGGEQQGQKNQDVV